MQMPSRPSRFLPTNTTFEGLCLGFAGTFLPNELGILSVFETVLIKTPFDLVSSLFMNMFGITCCLSVEVNQ